MVTSDNLIYYVEAVVEINDDETLLVNKQMIKTGFDDIPSTCGIKEEINKKQNTNDFLADLEKVRKAYVQDVSQKHSVKQSVTHDEPIVNTQYMQDGENNASLQSKTDVIDSNNTVDRLLRKERTSFVNKLSELMGIPYAANRDVLKPLFNDAWAEYKETGRVSQETVNNIFEQAFEHGRVISDEFYNNYKGLKDQIRTTKLTISDKDSSSVPNFKAWKQQQRGKVLIGEGGLPVDTFYGDLMSQYLIQILAHFLKSGNDRLVLIIKWNP